MAGLSGTTEPMKVQGKHYRSIRAVAPGIIEVIDQTRLPLEFELCQLRSAGETADAIRSMLVRGAPLIGATAAYGVAMAMRDDSSDAALKEVVAMLGETRPTAVNLHWALARMHALLGNTPASERADAAWEEAGRICDEDVAINEAIGREGLELIREAHTRHPERPVRILTHCNAGWFATVDWGTATAPIYMAHAEGIPVLVWVDETRPRNQGRITALELQQQGIAHEYVVDSAGGHLMQHGLVDMVITGCDRVTARGDVCNKIGTYLKALAAFDNEVPFYVATPGPTIDWQLQDGLKEIPIEARAATEVSCISGLSESGALSTVRILADTTAVRNDAFDVTPARLVTELITERGRCAASALAMTALYPEQAGRA